MFAPAERFEERFIEGNGAGRGIEPNEVTPLQEHKEDIGPLASHFLELASVRLNRPSPRLTQGNILTLQSYEWPGNVRELQNVIERAVITSRSRSLCIELPESDRSDPLPRVPVETQELEFVTEKEMRRRERDNIAAALQSSGWKTYGPDGAAELLGMKPTTLISRMKKLGLKKPG